MEVMKKLNFAFLCIIALILGLSPTQYCYPDILIKKDSAPPPEPGKANAKPVFTIPVSATIDNNELFVFFNSPIGIATVSIYDETDQLVYQTTVDSTFSTVLTIEVGGWESGSYKLRIAYNDVKLVGEFQL
jgi:hypothetical protein